MDLLKVVANDIEEFTHPEPRLLKVAGVPVERNIIHAIPQNGIVAVYTHPYPVQTFHTHEEIVRHVQSISGTILLESMLRSRARVTLLSL